MRKAIQALMFGGMLGKIMGLFRETVLAYYFGTGVVAVAFRGAVTVSVVPLNFFTADILTAAIIPLYKKYVGEDQRKADAFYWLMIVLFFLVSSACAALCFCFAPGIVRGFLPGLSSQAAETAVAFIRVLAPGLVIYIISCLNAFFLMAIGIYKYAATRPSYQSLGLIVGAAAAAILQYPPLLPAGFVAAYGVFLLITTASCVRHGVLRLHIFSGMQIRPIALEFWKLMSPLLALPVFFQGNIVVERAVSSLISDSAVAGLDYAKFLTDTGVTLIAAPIGVAALSNLSGADPEQLRQTTRKIVGWLLRIMLPVSVLVFANSGLIVRLIYMRGQFNGESAQVTSQIMKWMALGLWAQILGYVLIKVLNSMGRNRLVALYMAGGAIANAAINVLTYRIFGAAALGIGTTLGWCIVLLCCLRTLRLGMLADFRDVVICAAAVCYGLIAFEMTPDIHPDANHFKGVAALLTGIAFWTIVLAALFGKQYFKAVSGRFTKSAGHS